MEKAQKATDCRYKRLGVVVICCAGLLGHDLGNHASASQVVVDSITVSAIIGQATPNGIYITSSVYIASGSSLTLQGGGGVLVTGSSVTGSAFFGDGSHITGIAQLSDPNTFSGAATFTSSFTVSSGGRQIILSTSGISNNITISPTAEISFYPELHNSSFVSVAQQSTTNSVYGPCLDGSTITLVTNGARVELVFSGTLRNPTFGPGINFLVNGAYVGNLSKSKGFLGKEHEQPTSIDFLTDPLSAGTQQFCLTIAAPKGGTTTVLDSPTVNIFYAREIK